MAGEGKVDSLKLLPRRIELASEFWLETGVAGRWSGSPRWSDPWPPPPLMGPSSDKRAPTPKRTFCVMKSSSSALISASRRHTMTILKSSQSPKLMWSSCKDSTFLLAFKEFNIFLIYSCIISYASGGFIICRKNSCEVAQFWLW